MYSDRVKMEVVEACVEEYTSILGFTEAVHDALTDTLTPQLCVCSGVCVCLMHRGWHNSSPMPLVMAYLGLSMGADQVVNTSIDGEEHKRVLIPGQPRSAKHWYERYKQEPLCLVDNDK
jgi:hypothetical protein